MNLTSFQYINYIDEYLDKVLNYYSLYSPHFFCNYYKFKYTNSIIDDHPDTNANSYRLVGDLSGRVWDKIVMLPVWFVNSQGEINYRDTEWSLNRDIQMSVIMPDLVGIVPTAEDFIIFNQGVQIDSSQDPLEQPVFIVKGYDVSHIGKRRWYRINLKNSYIKRMDLEQQVNETYFYISQLREIYPIYVAKNILSIMDFIEDAIDYINNNKISFSSFIGVE